MDTIIGRVSVDMVNNVLSRVLTVEHIKNNAVNKELTVPFDVH